MAEKLEKARQRKQRNAIFGGVAAALLVIGGAVWAVVAMGDADKGPEALADDEVSCMWTPDDATANPDLKEVGAPPTGKAPNTGTQTMTITTNLGAIEVEVDTADAPCTARSMTYLASKNFFDNTKCHRLVTEGIKVLQCGDPSGTGRGGPTYKMGEENLPNYTEELKNYPKGTIAMAKTEQPNSTGSQFFIVWGDTPLSGDYTVLGKVTKGLEIVEKVGADGALEADPTTGATPPKTEVVIKTLTLTPAQEG
jgi:peptidyl-prolyl cis-trans isomerase B (cyclophilin B)